MDQIRHSLKAPTAYRLVTLLAAVLWIGGCSLTETYEPPRTEPARAGAGPALPPAQPQPQPPTPPSGPHPAPRPEREIALSPASTSLVKQAHVQIAHGDLVSASTTLDRALRIEPNNPLLWVELGRLRLAENDPHQAEVCARKALALGSGSRAAQVQASRLLSDARAAEGAAVK